MAWNTMITEQTLSVGEREFGPYVIPAEVAGVHIRLTKINWPDTGNPVISVWMDISLDQGKTWINDWAGWSDHGPILAFTPRFGDLENCTAARIKFPMTGDNKRRIRIHLNVMAPLTTQFEFEVL